MPKIPTQSESKLPKGFKWTKRRSDIKGLIDELICPHGVGHDKGVHGCDGCCAKVFFPTPPQMSEKRYTFNEVKEKFFPKKCKGHPCSRYCVCNHTCTCPSLTEGVSENGLIGTLAEDVYVYCNEKDEKRGKFLLKCCEGCKHNPIKPEPASEWGNEQLVGQSLSLLEQILSDKNSSALQVDRARKLVTNSIGNLLTRQHLSLLREQNERMGGMEKECNACENYDEENCPLLTKPEPVSEWEKEFDEKFVDKTYDLHSWKNSFLDLGGTYQVDEIKFFIRTLLTRQHLSDLREQNERMMGIKKDNPYRHEKLNSKDPLGHYGKIHEEIGWNAALSSLISHNEAEIKRIEDTLQ